MNLRSKDLVSLLPLLAACAMSTGPAVAKDVTDVYAHRTVICEDEGTRVEVKVRGKGEPFTVVWRYVASYRHIPGYDGPPLAQTLPDRHFNDYGIQIANWYPPRPLRKLVNRVRFRSDWLMELPMGAWGGGRPSIRTLKCR